MRMQRFITQIGSRTGFMRKRDLLILCARIGYNP
ncbi:hypothetical protein ACSSVQ_002153 [Parvibaculum sp. MBR-TMA-1.3b-4.2]|jgi:hypothetical protein